MLSKNTFPIINRSNAWLTGLLITLTLLVLAPAAHAAKPVLQAAEFHDFHNGDAWPGAAILVRDKHGANGQLALSGLDASAPYTVWWVVFNHPEHCQGGAGHCAEADLASPAVEASIFFATGFIASASGTANVAAGLTAGSVPEGAEVFFGPGLLNGNGFRAEIHMLLRTHRKVETGRVATQISRYEDQCADCSEQLAAVFAPVQHR